MNPSPTLRLPKILFAALSLATALHAALPAPAPHPTTGINLPAIGRIKVKSAAEIISSPWSIGGETLDRDYADYAKYQAYLGPLGAKGIRLQAGWARCERVPGVYEWDWLDAVIDDALAQGVQPWLQLSYGNPLYAGGGDARLGGGLPSSPEALAAWDRWVRALAERYRDRVREWEVWNEPDLNTHGVVPVEAYVGLYIRTATILREVQPAARIFALALARTPAYADRYLSGMQARNQLALIDAITIHNYPRNPDDTLLTDQVRALIAKYGAAIQVRQGETGAPSRYQENFALKRISLTETIQAKWNLRRLLAHRAKDVPMNLFTLSDMHYLQADNQGVGENGVQMNYKGLLATNPDRSISALKPAYLAAQVVFTVFDDTLERLPHYPFSSTALRGVALTGYQRTAGDGQVAAYWFADAPPAEANGVTLADFALPGGRFREPVLVDVRTNRVYAIPPAQWTQSAEGTAFRSMPVYDAPMLIAEKSALPLDPI